MNREGEQLASGEIHEVLVEARALIVDPERWCKGSHARTGEGVPVEPRSAQATQWCAAGAVGRVCPAFPLNFNAETALDDTARYFGFVVATTFNDDPATTHADVLALFNRAIEATR